MNKKIVVLLAVLVIPIVYFSMKKSDPLIERLNDFIEDIQVESGDNKVGRAFKADSLVSEYFDQVVSVNVPGYKTEADLYPSDIKTILALVLTTNSSFSLEMVDPVVVSRTEDGGVVEGVFKVERSKKVDVKELRVNMVKRDGNWLFAGCEELEILEK